MSRSARDELGMSPILPGYLAVTGRQRARVRLVITGIHHRRRVGLQPKSERERGMVQIAGRDLDVVDVERTLDQVVIADPGPALVERDGEIGVLHLPGQVFAQRLAEPLGPVDVPFVARHEQRIEERDCPGCGPSAYG